MGPIRVVAGTCDPEELTRVIEGTDMRHRILPGGALRADVRRIRLHHGILQRGSYGMSILVDGLVPAGMVIVGLIFDAPEPLFINGVACRAPDIQLYGENHEVCYRAPAGTTWVAYGVPAEQMREVTRLLYGRPLLVPERAFVAIQPGPAEARCIRSIVDALLNVAAMQSASSPSAPGWRLLEEQLILAIMRGVDSGDGQRRASWSRVAGLRNRIVDRAERYVDGRELDSFSLASFAGEVGASVRMLEYHFRGIYGVSPLAWFRSMKLNEVHRELLERGRGDVTVTEAATRHGFEHLGRFSQEYRKLFGELPSQTLARS